MITSASPLFRAQRTFERPSEGLVERLWLADCTRSARFSLSRRWKHLVLHLRPLCELIAQRGPPATLCRPRRHALIPGRCLWKVRRLAKALLINDIRPGVHS
jgi:hypothetical protein